ncbi:Hypothetical predicted protein [Lecanosticta acicola]|uniref:Uncharacterized protein n=1 Tax=Lecanosticta acicola TaxID=111012 RepID=A0AAI9EDB8_9PEZI|nr:Hypothetical predicted protein [Lecanosticta acicola]
MASPPTWQSANGASVPPKQQLSNSFTITATPKTDIWRRADDDDVFNAPMIYQTIQASDFKKLSATVFAPWKTQYDQGGLILAFPPHATSDLASSKGTKWIKAGIEYFSSRSVMGVVGTDRYSDWSLSPMSQVFHQKARIVMVREETTLWVYAAQDGSEELTPMREIKWAFMEGRGEGEVLVGVYAAKPTEETDGEESVREKGIEVTFSDVALERESDE